MAELDALKVKKENAEAVRLFLSRHGFFMQGMKAAGKGAYVLFPLVKRFGKKDFPELSGISFSFCKGSFVKAGRRGGNIKQLLKGRLKSGETDALVKSFDLLGNVAIIEVPRGLSQKAGLIARALMQANPSVESVFRKTGAHAGLFRAEPVKHVAGKKTAYALYRESGCSFRISLGKVFFSPRLSYERSRISRLIKKNEVVAALFAGVGPFPLVFAKNSGMKKAYAVELNPLAFADMVYNVKENKEGKKVVPVLADVKEFVPAFLKGKCDRVVMPLPKGGESFLREAVLCLKPRGGVIHFYGFADKEDLYSGFIRKINEAAASEGRKAEVLFSRKVRDYSPETVQVVIDFRVGSGKRKKG
jgi:tRNA (guanine37-N1)-methyltransferase